MVYQDIKQIGKEEMKRSSIWEGTCSARTTYKRVNLNIANFIECPRVHGVHLLADKVVDSTKDTNSTGRQSNQLPGEVASRVLLVSTEAQTGTDESCDGRIGKEDRVAGVSAEPTGLRLARLGLLLLVLALALLLLFGFALYPFSLGAGLHILLEEVGFHSLNMGPVDVDQGGRAL
jgi:hypothetical protein